jgi:hypothetical protein
MPVLRYNFSAAKFLAFEAAIPAKRSLLDMDKRPSQREITNT